MPCKGNLPCFSWFIFAFSESCSPNKRKHLKMNKLPGATPVARKL